MQTHGMDMQKVLARYRAMLDPGAAEDEILQRRGRHAARYADDSHAFLPGTWFMAGHHNGRQEIDALWDAVGTIWPKGTRLFRTHFFVGEDTIVVEWWSRNAVWNGVEAQNSGVGRLRFRGDEVIDHYEITDSEYFEEIHGDWRTAIGDELGPLLPRWSQRQGPFYPDPANNEWAIDHSPTDGSSQVPAALEEAFARTRDWWQSPGSCDLSPFAEDVTVFYQGRIWPLGGTHHGLAGLEGVEAVSSRLWSNVSYPKLNFWAGDGRILIEWFCERTLFDGRRCRDGGYTVWHWEGDRVASVRTYLDTSLYAEVLTGWREVVGEKLGATLPNWRRSGEPRYPIPGIHE